MTRTMEVTPENAQSIVVACCTLHNLLRVRYPQMTNALVDREDPQTHHVYPGQWRQRRKALVADLENMRGNNATKEAKALRDYMKGYFHTVGRVPWQDAMAKLH
jgi:hypothetical protein